MKNIKEFVKRNVNNLGITCAGVILFANVAKSGFLKNTLTPPVVLLSALTA